MKQKKSLYNTLQETSPSSDVTNTQILIREGMNSGSGHCRYLDGKTSVVYPDKTIRKKSATHNHRYNKFAQHLISYLLSVPLLCV